MRLMISNGTQFCTVHFWMTLVRWVECVLVDFFCLFLCRFFSFFFSFWSLFFSFFFYFFVLIFPSFFRHWKKRKTVRKGKNKSEREKAQDEKIKNAYVRKNVIEIETKKKGKRRTRLKQKESIKKMERKREVRG